MGMTLNGPFMEMVGLGFCFALSLFYAIATAFQLYLDGDMMYKMKRNPKPTPLPSQGIFNLPYYIGMNDMRGTGLL